MNAHHLHEIVWVSFLLRWLNPLLRLGYSRELQIDDLPRVLKEDESKRLGEKLEE